MTASRRQYSASTTVRCQVVPFRREALKWGTDRRRVRRVPQTASRHCRVARFSASDRTAEGRAAAAGAAVYVSALEDGLTRIEQSGVNRIYAPSRRHRVPLDEHRLKVERDLGISSPAHGETSRVLQVASDSASSDLPSRLRVAYRRLASHWQTVPAADTDPADMGAGTRPLATMEDRRAGATHRVAPRQREAPTRPGQRQRQHPHQVGHTPGNRREVDHAIPSEGARRPRSVHHSWPDNRSARNGVGLPRRLGIAGGSRVSGNRDQHGAP